MNVQGDFSPLFRGGLRKDFLDSWQDFEPEYSQYLKTGTMDGPELEGSLITGLTRLTEIGDGQPIPLDVPVMGPKAVLIDKEFAMGFLLTRKTVEDDKYGKANQGAKWLAEAARMTSEARSAALLDDAFNGSTFKTIDNKALCATDHVVYGNGGLATSMSNSAATPVGLSVTGINALLELAELSKNWNGDPTKIVCDTIIYSPKYIGLAMQIFGAGKEPFTANNQENVVPKRLPGIKHVVSRWKSSTETYFLVSSKKNDAMYMTRRAIDFKSTYDERTQAMQNFCSTRFAIGVFDYHGWFGQNAS